VTQLPGANEFPEAEWSTAYTPCRSYVKGRDSWGAADEASLPVGTGVKEV